MTTTDPAGIATSDLETEAAALDAADALRRHRDAFVGAETSLVYFDGNSLGRPLRASIDRLTAFARDEWGGRLIRGWDESWMQLPFDIGDAVGRAAIGASPGQTVIGDSTTVLLYKMVRAAFDAAVAADPARVEIVVDRDNFPTDRYLVDGIAAERGGRVRWIDVDTVSGVSAEALRAAVGRETAVVLLSHVAYRSGLSHGCRGSHPHRPRGGCAHRVGPLPLGGLGAGRGRCMGVRHRRRLHVQVPERGAGLPRLRLCRGATPGPPRAADPGLDGHGRRVRDGPGVPARGGHAAVPLGHARRSSACSRCRTRSP